MVPTEGVHLRHDGHVEAQKNNAMIFHQHLHHEDAINLPSSTTLRLPPWQGLSQQTTTLKPPKGEDQHASDVTKCDTVQQSAYSIFSTFPLESR